MSDRLFSKKTHFVNWHVVGDQIAYRYAIRHELGSGSFGSVLACHDYKHNCEVAVKIIKSQHKFTVQAQSEVTRTHNAVLSW